MDKQRKIRCDCGKFLIEQVTSFDDIATEAMVCPNCGFTTLTKEQAQKYMRLKDLHKIIDSERKIIKIGNSMGLTLPDQLHDYGAKVGKKVKIEALTENSFKVELV